MNLSQSTLDQRKLQNCQEELRQARDEIHRLKHQHLNDECANRMLLEEIKSHADHMKENNRRFEQLERALAFEVELRCKYEELNKLSICGCGDGFTEHDPGTCGNCVAAGNSHLRAKIDWLSEAMQQTLDENGHLADGENCTLIALKRALNIQTCRKCGGDMLAGKAIEQTWTGIPDFPGDKHAVTVSPGGSGKLVDCLKCELCGWSITTERVAA